MTTPTQPIQGGQLTGTIHWTRVDCNCGQHVKTYFSEVKDVDMDDAVRQVAVHQTVSGCQIPRIIYDVNVHVATIYRPRVTYNIYVRKNDTYYQVLRDNGKETKVIGSAGHIWQAIAWAVDEVVKLSGQNGVKGVEVHLNPASVVTGEGLQGMAPPDFDTALTRFAERINSTESTKELVKVRLEAERYRTAFESITTLVDAKLLRHLPD